MNLGQVDVLAMNGVLLGLVKFMFLAGSLIYIVFALIIVRQITMMRKTLITSFSPIILTLGLAHLALSILVFFFMWALL